MTDMMEFTEDQKKVFLEFKESVQKYMSTNEPLPENIAKMAQEFHSISMKFANQVKNENRRILGDCLQQYSIEEHNYAQCTNHDSSGCCC